MAEEEQKKVETEAPSEATPPPAPEVPEAEPPVVDTPKDVPEEKSVVPHTPEEKTDDSKALAVVEKPSDDKSAEGSVHRDAVLERVETEKRLTLITAWEESEKCKAENKAQRKLSDVGSWEKSRKANVEAELKKIEETLEKKKAAYIEKLKNKEALVHKKAEEKRAVIEAKRGEDLLKAEEAAAKYRATHSAPKKLLFGYF